MRVVKHLSNTTQVIDELEVLPNQLYCFNLKAPKIRMASFSHYSNISSKVNTDIMHLWHDRLGDPGNTMIRRMINNVQNLPLKLEYLNQARTSDSCAQGKLVIRPSLHKEPYESPKCLENIDGDIHGPMHPLSGPFYYFMGVKDASSCSSHVTLLSTCNMALPQLIIIIKLRAQFPDFPIKSIRMDNVVDFTSATFIRYCESIVQDGDITDTCKILCNATSLITDIIISCLLSPSTHDKKLGLQRCLRIYGKITRKEKHQERLIKL